jgi:hypothetical protein
MSVTAMDNGHNLWAETDCAQTELPCMCREGGPPSQQQVRFCRHRFPLPVT